ncbi:response regulator transcription factor [Flavobacterium sp.]|uniref:response regulator transcription factor n=1 Tax=Flavobacterium sp. TaxID=239 RepID=UPI00286DC0DB|nr:response regulator transcription factor [Flavobacterium sp.]
MNSKILIVEDEVIIAMHIQSILEEANYEVISNISSVEVAISAIETASPDLVLIDINLNKNKDGVDLGRYLLEKNSIPYIYITSYSDKTTLDRVNETRPFGYIVKPFRPLDLITTISVVLNNYKHRKIDPLREENETPDSIPFKMRTIINYINDNLDRKIEIEELIKLSNWKARHFSRLFQDYLKVSPYQYILSRKISKAKSLIEETTIPINEIAFDLGFKSYSNFCNAFKKAIDDTPENCRKKK